MDLSNYEERMQKSLTNLRGTAYFRHINAVHNRCHHANLVGFRPVNRLTGAAAPEIAAANVGTVVIGDINCTSVLVAGAVKGNIEVYLPLYR